MTYTAPEVLTFIAALGVLITGVGAVVVNIIVALRTGTKIDAAMVKTDGLIHQVQEVHTITNSNLSAVKAELATATSQIVALRDLVHDLKAERAKAAVIVALNTPVGPHLEVSHAQAVLEKIDVTQSAAVSEKLGQIETNTAATVEALKKER